jgi:FkbM family methyltransferase
MNISFQSYLSKGIKSNNFLYFLAYPIIYIRRLILKFRANQFNKYYSHIFSMVREGSLVLDIPEFQGVFEMDCRSNFLRLVIQGGGYEKEIVDIIKKNINPLGDAIDVGANIGLFTILFSKLILDNNKVLSIEPTPTAVKYLRKNIERNNSKNTIIYEGVATNVKGNCQINIIAGMEEYSSIGKISHFAVRGKKYDSYSVKGDTIDNLVENYDISPGFIKVDTEGAEYLVFSGAVNVIKKYKPIILSELSDNLMANLGNNSQEVISILKEFDYKIIDIENSALFIKKPFNGTILAIPR